MVTNETITLYNKVYNKQTRLNDWSRTVLKGINLYKTRQVNQSGTGYEHGDVYKIRIPENVECSKVYASENRFAHPDKEWTLQTGDYIVIGECSQSITKPSELTEYGDCCRIMAWSDRRVGSIRHWRVEGQ